MDVRLFLGTGHAGAAWLACTFLEGSFSRNYALGDETEIEEFCGSFGRTGGYLTELCAEYPGVLWPSGELGYTLGVAHGHALSTGNGTVVAVVGDGELETAPTSAALHGIRKFRDRASRLTIVINLNGLRMGGPSEISTWTDLEIQKYFAAFGLRPNFVEGFDVRGLAQALEKALLRSHKSGPPSLIILRTPKGATMPPTRSGGDVAGTTRSHKVPVKRIEQAEDVAWVQEWLRSYKLEQIFKNGLLDRAPFKALLPASDLLIGNARERIARDSQGNVHAERVINLEPDSTAVQAFVKAVESEPEELPKLTLLTSPDELASNRLHTIDSSKIEIVEYLSEHQCLAWSIGAVTCGRASWYTSYDAFAPIISSMLTQYLKFLDSGHRSGIPMFNRPLNIFLTSLAWRNVYSHQDPGLASSLLEKRFSSFYCFQPASPLSTAKAVGICSQRLNTVARIIADKRRSAWTLPKSELGNGIPFTLAGRWEAEKTTFRITFLVTGDYLVREAMFAAEVVASAAKNTATQTIVLEELTWLYRPDGACDALRAEFQRLIDGSDLFMLTTSLYEDVVSSLIRHVLWPQCNMTSHGFRSSSASVTPVSVLLESKSSWLQLAAEALAQTLNHSSEREAKEIFAAIGKLRGVEDRLRRELERAYDEPEWYWRLKPQDILA
jgi:xylulose-5-phosphate/fructose-6-phosphate phosphoketolase